MYHIRLSCDTIVLVRDDMIQSYPTLYHIISNSNVSKYDESCADLCNKELSLVDQFADIDSLQLLLTPHIIDPDTGYNVDTTEKADNTKNFIDLKFANYIGLLLAADYLGSDKEIRILATYIANFSIGCHTINGLLLSAQERNECLTLLNNLPKQLYQLVLSTIRKPVLDFTINVPSNEHEHLVVQQSTKFSLDQNYVMVNGYVYQWHNRKLFSNNDMMIQEGYNFVTNSGMVGSIHETNIYTFHIKDGVSESRTIRSIIPHGEFLGSVSAVAEDGSKYLSSNNTHDIYSDELPSFCYQIRDLGNNENLFQISLNKTETNIRHTMIMSPSLALIIVVKVMVIGTKKLTNTGMIEMHNISSSNEIKHKNIIIPGTSIDTPTIHISPDDQYWAYMVQETGLFCVHDAQGTELCLLHIAPNQTVKTFNKNYIITTDSIAPSYKNSFNDIHIYKWHHSHPVQPLTLHDNTSHTFEMDCTNTYYLGLDNTLIIVSHLEKTITRYTLQEYDTLDNLFDIA